MGRVPSRGSEQFVLRMPDGMRDRLKAEAEKNGRSMNSEIVQRIGLTFDQDDAAAESNERYRLLEKLNAGEIDRSQVPDWPPDEEGDPGPDLNDAPHDIVRSERMPTSITVKIQEAVRSAIVEALAGDELRRLREELAAQREALLRPGDVDRPASDIEDDLTAISRGLDALRATIELRASEPREPFMPRVVGEEPNSAPSAPTRSAPAPDQARKGGKGEK